MNTIINHPASLFIGNEQELLENTISLLQSVLCASVTNKRQNNSSPLTVNVREANVPVRQSLGVDGSSHVGPCSVCTQCRKVQEQQHESILWLMPEKQYAVEDLKPIFSTISYALEADQHYFIVIQKADLLTTACANALLKSLEEPPTGYRFILLAQRIEFILPTIKSRCLIQTVGNSSQSLTQHPLMPYFTTASFQDPLAFSKELDAANPNEWESLSLLDELLVHWATDYKKHIITRNQKGQNQALAMMQHLKKAILNPPMPGSSKLFWKNLFLQIKEL